MKKIPGDIILYKSTINDNHMIYVPKICCMTDVVVIFLFGLFFVFLPPNSPKNENFKKKKKIPGDITILQKCIKNHDHMLYCSWDLACDKCNCYFSFWTIFCPLTPHKNSKNENLKKNEKFFWRYNHFTQVYQKSWLDYVWFLRYGAWWMDGQMDGRMKVTYRDGCPT